MPREITHSARYGQAPRDPETGQPVGPEEARYAAVGWDGHRGSPVQLGIIDPNEGGENDDLALWIDLDRDGVNRLIASLRRGRTKSYGKDE